MSISMLKLLALLLSTSFIFTSRETIPLRSLQSSFVNSTIHSLDFPSKETRLEITPSTKVYLDGKRTSLLAIPQGSEVLLLEIAKDGKIVIRMEFRRKK